MGSFFCSLVYHLTSLIQVALAVAIIVIVAIKLDNVTVTYSDNVTDEINSSCALGNPTESGSLCAYTYAVAGISLAVSAAISILQCCTCNLCGLGKFLDLIFAGAGTVWWVIAAGVVQKNVKDAADLEGSAQDYRDATVALMWVEVALFALLVVTGFFRACGCLTSCCGGSKA